MHADEAFAKDSDARRVRPVDAAACLREGGHFVRPALDHGIQSLEFEVCDLEVQNQDRGGGAEGALGGALQRQVYHLVGTQHSHKAFGGGILELCGGAKGGRESN